MSKTVHFLSQATVHLDEKSDLPSFCSRDWKDHKMVCGVAMDMDPAVRDEAYSVIAGAEGLARIKAELGIS